MGQDERGDKVKKEKVTVYALRNKKSKLWFGSDGENSRLAVAYFYSTRALAKAVKEDYEEIVPLRVTVLTSKKRNIKRTR